MTLLYKINSGEVKTGFCDPRLRREWRNLAESSKESCGSELAALPVMITINISSSCTSDRVCGLVVRVLGYRSGGPGSIPGTTRKK
jgi:hypothetical protein